MKMMLCSNIMLGAECSENIDTKQLHKWKELRADKFSELAVKAIPAKVSDIVIVGKLFGLDRIPEKTIDEFFAVINDQSHIRFIVFLVQSEYSRLNYRNDIPENLKLICTQLSDTYEYDNLKVEINHGQINLISNDSEITLMKNSDGMYAVSGLSEEVVVPGFEATGYDDADEFYGYLNIELENGSSSYELIENKKFIYETIELKITPEDTQKDIVKKLIPLVNKYEYKTFLQVNITGRAAFGFRINCDELESSLRSRVLYSEVYDNTIMDIDEESFETDISLRSEFVRLALSDDSLSEAERNRIISCGWNALHGKEVSAE